MDNPCKNCITFAMCKSLIYKKRDWVMILINKCDLVATKISEDFTFIDNMKKTFRRKNEGHYFFITNKTTIDSMEIKL